MATQPLGRRMRDKFAAGGFWFKPVKGLTRGNETYAGISESGGFGGAVNTDEARIGGEIFSPASRISLLGSTPKTALPFLRKSSARNPVPEPMFRYRVGRREQALHLHEVENATG